MTSAEVVRGGEEPELLPETEQALEALRQNPATAFHCVFGDGPAVIIRQMDKGCVGLPGVVYQPLCAQHDVNRTPLNGDIGVVDLSVNARWSEIRGEDTVFGIFRRDGVMVLEEVLRD